MKRLHTNTEYIPVESIIVGERIREARGNLDELRESIEKHGLINPIVIDNKKRLVAGQRRFEAVKQLGWRNIPVLRINTTDLLEKLKLEIEENRFRKDFTQEEYKRALHKKKILTEKKNLPFLIFLWRRFVDFIKNLFKIDED